MKKIILLFFLFYVVKQSYGLFISTQTAYAAEFEKLNIPSQSINPGNFYFPSVRLWEKIEEKLKFSADAKNKYLNHLIDKRMSELGYVVKNRRLDEVQRSSERLAYQAGTLTDFLISQKSEQMKDQLRIKLNGFLPALSELRDYFPANSSFWLLVQHDINSLKEYSEKLN